jgi:hypothetical protein
MRKLVCDICENTTPDNDDTRREWTALGLAKVQGMGLFPPPFETHDLCPECTAKVRRWAQKGGEIGA